MVISAKSGLSNIWVARSCMKYGPQSLGPHKAGTIDLEVTCHTSPPFRPPHPPSVQEAHHLPLSLTAEQPSPLPNAWAPWPQEGRASAWAVLPQEEVKAGGGGRGSWKNPAATTGATAVKGRGVWGCVCSAGHQLDSSLLNDFLIASTGS